MADGRFDRFRARLSRMRQSSVHQGGMKWVKQELGIGKEMRGPGMEKFLGRWVGRGFLGYSAITGYQEGGITGAVTGVGSHMASTYAFGAGARMLGIATGGLSWAMAGVAGAAGIGASLHVATGGSMGDFVRPWVNEHIKRSARLEMGTPVLDQFGTVSTMRQRSLQAIQNSKLNGRVGLGNEAALTFQPYFR